MFKKKSLSFYTVYWALEFFLKTLNFENKIQTSNITEHIFLSYNLYSYNKNQ